MTEDESSLPSNSGPSLQKRGSDRSSLSVYIEGDGLAWVSRNHLSWNPTPYHPVGLLLAMKDDSENVVYLARPCQYTEVGMNPACKDSVYWSNRRFSKEVIDSMNQAVDILKERAGAVDIHLVGYSGGGAVVALIAAERTDVKSLRTVAGNLDPVGFSQYHKVSPMTGSLNPMEVAQRLQNVPQIHFSGGEDNIVPPFIADDFVDQLGSPRCAQAVVIHEASHGEGWVERWKDLLARPVECRK